ncbi:MAG: hypothetical protein JNM55_23005 [Anaerolineales bacterium]|nr:hypothetical protein [Anaerolineales bacterium]
MSINNPALQGYNFLEDMATDSYFPGFLVDKGKQILIRLCEAIEKQKPLRDEEIYKLTHAATEEFNKLAEEFEANDSEIETMARDAIAGNFAFIVRAYGFENLDLEEVIAPREW